MTQSQGPQGREWADVVEGLHALTTMVTVRTHYAEGHPAIARADELAGGFFQRLLQRLPELVLALIDGEFVVCERPMPISTSAFRRSQRRCSVTTSSASSCREG